MSYPPLVILASEADYEKHFRQKYCHNLLMTFDGIGVRFSHADFRHAFYQDSAKQKKASFSKARARKIDWIEAALQDKNAELRCGWHRSRKKVDPTRRVALLEKNYVVVVQMLPSGGARFITAYEASRSTVEHIRKSPKWPPLP